MRQGWAEGLARRRVPEPGRAVLAPGETVLPSGLNATAPTPLSCVRVRPMGWPVAASQSRAVLSWLPVITVLPSGLNATASTTS